MAELLDRVHPIPVEGLTPFPVSWQTRPPVLHAERLRLRELTEADARPLASMVAVPEVARYISAPPASADRIAAFAAWGHRERAAGRYIAFGIVPHGSDTPIGLLQLRLLDPSGHSAEWGVILGSAQWGAGLFVEASQLLLQFAFDVVGVHRVEARVASGNGRAQAAMRKLGAVQEGVLRRALVTADGTCHDQVLWSVLAEDWRASERADVGGRVH
jgi:RimJ/RimL family protein N-acetyltransferase